MLLFYCIAILSIPEIDVYFIVIITLLLITQG